MNNPELTPIPTTYKGVTFRSRAEAKWAVYLDSLDVAWEYESEGYQLPSGNYLPDFVLPHYDRAFVEVKAEGAIKARDVIRCAELAQISRKPVVMLRNFPTAPSYFDMVNDVFTVIQKSIVVSPEVVDASSTSCSPVTEWLDWDYRNEWQHLAKTEIVAISVISDDFHRVSSIFPSEVFEKTQPQVVSAIRAALSYRFWQGGAA